MFICGNCKGRHNRAVEARACYAGNLFDCGWLVLQHTEDGPVEVECGAPAIQTDRGWSCQRGHSHVYAEVSHREGWGYAEDGFEAWNLESRGVVAMQMDGRARAHAVRPGAAW